MVQEIDRGTYHVRLFLDETAALPGILYLIGDDGAGETLWNRLRVPRPALAVVSGMDWNRELSPWQAEKVFSKGEDFMGEGEDFLFVLTDTLIPETETRLPFSPSFRGIAGYSLAGLFALWALYQTDRFDRAASLSGSLWFDGFVPFAETHPLRQRPEMIILSYGDREPGTRNERMRTVGLCTERLAVFYAEKGIPTQFSVRPGGHFDRVEETIADGLNSLY